MAAIDAGALQIAFVTGPDGHLDGIVTDGDIRRALLAGAEMGDSVLCAINRKPRCLTVRQTRAEALTLMRQTLVHQAPVIDDQGVLVNVLSLDELLRRPERPNWVILMAGGLGMRLRPLTDNCPKPMLKVGGRPLLETTICNLREQGFRNFFLSVNYKAEMIEEHFADGATLGVKIQYLRETQRLGTAGALSLLPERPSEPVIVANGDILTTLDFGHMLDFHRSQESLATMGIRDYEVAVPYGVIDTDGSRITGMREKPVHRFYVNSGLYALAPEALDLIPADAFYDMPTLFEQLQAKDRRTVAFQIREYWMDIGRLEDLSRANAEFDAVFGR
jgi:dTDP-glucose pyrophosphorylase